MSHQNNFQHYRPINGILTPISSFTLLKWGNRPKNWFGHNFWPEGPIDLKTTRLDHILQDLFMWHPFDHIWSWCCPNPVPSHWMVCCEDPKAPSTYSSTKNPRAEPLWDFRFFHSIDTKSQLFFSPRVTLDGSNKWTRCYWKFSFVSCLDVLTTKKFSPT